MFGVCLLLNFAHAFAIRAFPTACPRPFPILKFASSYGVRSSVPAMCSPELDDASPPSLRASEISKEFAKYATTRVRVTQSAPIRFGVGALADFRSVCGQVGKFYASAFKAVPMHMVVLVLTVIAYGAQQMAGKAAILAGARMNHAIIRHGQLHRLIAPLFLHHSALHLLSNCFSLWRIGPLANGAFGSARLLLIYLLSGVGGNLFGLWLGSARAISVGASGAVFGMIGAVASFAFRNRESLGRGANALMSSAGQILALNLFIGLQPRSGIDNLGHFGGCAVGAVLGLILAPDLSRLADEQHESGFMPSWLVSGLLTLTIFSTLLSVRSTVVLTRTLRALAGQ